MDPVTITYYALVCAVLSLFAPRLGGSIPRLFVGALVGMLAAGVLPQLRGVLPVF